MNLGNQTSSTTPLPESRLIRFLGKLARKETVRALTYDEAIKEAAQKSVWLLRPGNGNPLAPDTILRDFTPKDRFATVDYGDVQASTIVKGGKTFSISPNLKYGGELVFEVLTQWAYEQLMSSPDVYEIATDWEAARRAAGLAGEVAANAEAYRNALTSIGFVTEDTVLALIAKIETLEAIVTAPEKKVAKKG